MFYFVNFSGDQKSQSYDQGKLFENLVKKIVDVSGFDEIELREKISGKEYDIRARSKIGKRQLIGEAKARHETQTVTTISSFIGSLENEDIPTDAIGLFMSISDLAPDAKDFLSKNRSRDKITTIIGNEIIEKLSKCGYPTLRQVKNWADHQFHMRTGDTHLLVSDRGDFFLQLLARNNESRIKAFSVYDHQGNRIEESSFGKEIKTRIEDFHELFFLPSPQNFITHLDDEVGIIAVDKEGAGWFEHKLPASPDRFIGRKDKIKDFINYVDSVLKKETNIRVYQILSRSGVGKSSFLLKIHKETESIGFSIFQDARNFRGTIDLLSLVQEFVTEGFNKFGINEIIPTNKSDILENMSGIDKKLSEQNMVGVIFVDQFESLFSKPELYAEFVDLVLIIVHKYTNILVCLARKNDQPTTFDDKEIVDLQHLRQLSKSAELDDFSSTEAKELISHLDTEIQETLMPKLRDMILEFSASGFPWLVKRMGAHIKDMIIKEHMSQSELIQNGVRPDELFKEDLSELDIVDREFLRELVHYLPATVEDLSQIEKFRGNLLSTKLGLFQDQRLIRLIGRTYDTYNDVFKYYLKFNDIPRLNKYTFRASPTTSIRLLRMILKEKPQSVEEIQKNSKLDSGTIFNALRELRMLGLIDYTRGQLTIDKKGIDAFAAGELDLYVKEQVWVNNNLVQDILTRINAEGKVELKELIRVMKESLPLLDLSEDTWEIYARTLVSWLRYVGLTNPNAITSDGRSMGVTKRGRQSEYFLPSSYVNQIISLMNKFGGRETIPLSELHEIRWAKSDCVKLGLIEETEPSVLRVTLTGEEFILNQFSRSRVFRDLLNSLDYMPKYLSQIDATKKSHLDVLKTVLGNTGFTEETWIWRSKILSNWLLFAGLVQREHGKIVRSSQPDFFNTQN